MKRFDFSGGSNAAHLHAHLTTLELDQNTFGVQCSREVLNQLIAKPLLKLWLPREVVQATHDAPKTGNFCPAGFRCSRFQKKGTKWCAQRVEGQVVENNGFRRSRLQKADGWRSLLGANSR